MADRAVEGRAAARDASSAPPGVAERLANVSRGVWATIACMAALAVVLLVQAPVLGHYFFGDDFVPLADIELRSPGAYFKNLFLLRDVTPNWRFLAGTYYFVMYKGFELNAMPFFLGALIVHLGTAALLFWLVWRAFDNAWAASFAAALFGVAAASVPTVGQVTAFNNVLAAFLMMIAIVTLYEGIERRQLRWVGPASVVAFAAAISANESAAVLAPVLVLVALWRVTRSDGRWRDQSAWFAPAIVGGAHALLGVVATASFAACRCTEASREGVAGNGSHLFGNFWIYLGRLLYPIGMEAPGHPGTAHLVAALAVLAVAIAALVRGPALARIAVAFLVMALLPYLTIEFALAGRYVYMPSIAFAILAAFLFVEAARVARAVSPALPAVVVVLAIAAVSLNGWQTWEQNQVHDAASEQWRELVDGLKARYPTLPEDSKVIVRGGPFTAALWQFYVLPSAGLVTWGDNVAIEAVPEEQPTVCRPPYGPIFAVDYDGGRFTPVPIVDEPVAPQQASGVERPLVAIDCPPPTFAS